MRAVKFMLFAKTLMVVLVVGSNGLNFVVAVVDVGVNPT